MHSLLVRQLKKFKPGNDMLDLAGLTEAVSQAYASFDADRAQIEHSLETMSRELGTRNRQMAEQLEQKQKMMNELTRANVELRELNSKFETAQSQLLQSEKMASIGQLAAGVAHEINNPIAFVHSNLGALERYVQGIVQFGSTCIQSTEGLPASEREQLDKLRKQLEYDYIVTDVAVLISESKEGLTRVKKIVQDLKDFSRVDLAEWDRVDLTSGLINTLNLVRHEFQGRIEVVCEFTELPDIECVLSQLNQVFMNILMNAVQAIEGTGVIIIGTGVSGENVWVNITDSGKGIPEEYLSRVFDTFFTTKPVGVGTGLGLSLCYGIVKRHHGHIVVDSQPGQGSTFKIMLPITQTQHNLNK